MEPAAAISEHPAPDTIVELVHGRLSASRGEELRAHFDECEACRGAAAFAAVERRREGAIETAVDAPGVARLPDLHPGARVAGRYTIEARLGSGGMAVVWAARDGLLERPVALKVIRGDSPAAAERLAARLLRESKAMARLRHPNVVTVYDVVTDGPRLCIAMELVRGATLRAWCEARARGWKEVLAVFVAAGRGLAAAHAVGLVHRDFKPDNVLVDDTGRALVGDFGLSRSVEGSTDSGETAAAETRDTTVPRGGDEALTRSGARLGTPAYMAPEQYRGATVDARADVFSFCVALYEALAGRRPFAGHDLDAIQTAVERGPPPLPDRAGQSVPRWLAAAVRSGLAADPAARPATMSELLRRLRPPRRRLILPGAIAVALAAIGWAVVPPSPREPTVGVDPCTGPDPLARLEGSGALDEAPGARARIDAWERTWRAAWSEACAAAPSTEAARLTIAARRACLQSQASRLGMVLAVAEVGMVGADEATRTLPSVDVCTDDRRIDLLPVPSDPQTFERVDALRERIAALQTVQSSGRWNEVERESAPLLAEARDLGFLPLVAEALYLRGTNAAFSGDAPRAKSLLLECAEAATAGRHDIQAAEAWIFLMTVAYGDLGDPERALEYGGQARAALDRLGDAPVVPEIECRYLLARGEIESAGPDPTAAEATLARAGELCHAHAPEHATSADEALALLYAATDRADEAVLLHESVLRQRQRTLEPDHPHILLAHLNLAGTLVEAGRAAEALAPAQAAIAIGERRGDLDHPDLQRARIDYAEVLRSVGRPAEALAQSESALAALERTPGASPVLLAYAGTAASAALQDLDRFGDAVAHAEAALAAAEKSDPDGELAIWVRTTLCDALALGGRAPQAVELMRAEAKRVAGTVGDPQLLGLVRHTLGSAFVLAGEPSEAIEHLEAALRSYAKLRHDRGLRADAGSWLGRARWESGDREQGSRLVRAAAHELAGHADAGPRLSRLRAWATDHGVPLD